MKEFVVSFSDEEIALLEEEFENMKSRDLNIKTLEDYIAQATMTHCRTMHVASSMMGSIEGIEDLLMQSDHIHVGVINMPMQLNQNIDKEEFNRYLSDALNKAIEDYNDDNNGPIN